MISKLLTGLFLAVSSGLTLACDVHLPSNLLVLGESVDLIQSLQHTECNEETLRDVGHTLSSVEGKMTSFQLAEILKGKGHDVSFQPNFIQVQHLKNLIREQLLIPSGVQLRSSEAVNSPNFLSLAPGDRVDVQCIGCLYGLQQPLNVNVYGFDGSNRSLTVRADFKKMVKAYRILSFQPAFSEITSQSLKEEFTESIPQTDLVTNLSTLKFFKLNKPLRAGELLRQSDLNAMSLVKAGLKTDVIIENSLVRIQTSGISRSNGTLGEIVEVFHPQKNKKYQGRVIDINKVLVEL
jgi:flagella basal body P-ring formation protein FlgA